MMCGLPCSGKSTWVEKHMNENRAKHFHLIGNECIMDRKWLKFNKDSLFLPRRHPDLTNKE